MNKEHHVIIGPGIDGRTDTIKFLTRNWRKKYGLTPHVLNIVWKDDENFAPKLALITNAIDTFAQRGDTVSLVGCSASGSAMLNAYIARKDVVNKVVNIGGFLRPGNSRGLRSFERRSAVSIAFRESVLRFAELETMLSAQDRKKILTVTPLFGDELVPPDTVVIQGAINLTVPMGEHLISIATALSSYRPVAKFLKGNNSE